MTVIEKMSKEEHDRMLELVDKVIVKFGIDKKWEEAARHANEKAEAERRAREEAEAEIRRTKEEAEEKERRAKDEAEERERRANEEIRLLKEKIKNLEMKASS